MGVRSWSGPTVLCLLVAACSALEPPGGCDGADLDDGRCDCNDGNFPDPPIAECSPGVLKAPAICCNGRFEGCECNTYGCSILSTNCLCSAGGGEKDARSCQGDICCVRAGITSACSCNSAVRDSGGAILVPARPCSNDEVQVPSCSADTAGCGDGETRVDRCTG